MEEVALENKEVKLKKEHIWTDKLSLQSLISLNNTNNSHSTDKEVKRSDMQQKHIQTFYLIYVIKSYINYSEQNINATLVFASIFHELTQRSKPFSIYTKGRFLSNIVHKSL